MPIITGNKCIFMINLDPTPTYLQNNLLKRLINFISKNCQVVGAYYNDLKTTCLIHLLNAEQRPSLLKLNGKKIDFYVIKILETNAAQNYYSYQNYNFIPIIYNEQALNTFISNPRNLNSLNSYLSKQYQTCETILGRTIDTFSVDVSSSLSNTDELLLVQYLQLFIHIEWYVHSRGFIYIKVENPEDINRLYELDRTLSPFGFLQIAPKAVDKHSVEIIQIPRTPIYNSNEESEIIQVVIYDKSPNIDQNDQAFPNCLFTYKFKQREITTKHKFHLLVYEKTQKQLVDQLIDQINKDINRTASIIDYEPYTIRVESDMLLHNDNDDVFKHFSQFGFILKISNVYNAQKEFVMIQFSDLEGYKTALTSTSSFYKITPAMNSDPIFLGDFHSYVKNELPSFKISIDDIDNLNRVKSNRLFYGLLRQIPKSQYSIKCSSSEYDFDSNAIGSILNSSISSSMYFSSKDQPNQFIEFQFPNLLIEITSFVIKTIPFKKYKEHLKSFDIEISIDGQNFKTFLSVHDCQDLNKPNQIVVFKCFDSPPFHYLRLKQTGKNWAGTDVLALSSIEFFGSVLTEQECKRKFAEKVRADSEKKRKEMMKKRVSIQNQLSTRRYQMGAIPMSPLEQSLFLSFRDCFELELRKALPSLSENDITMTLFEMFQNLPPELKLGINHKK